MGFEVSQLGFGFLSKKVAGRSGRWVHTPPIFDFSAIATRFPESGEAPFELDPINRYMIPPSTFSGSSSRFP